MDTLNYRCWTILLKWIQDEGTDKIIIHLGKNDVRGKANLSDKDAILLIHINIIDKLPQYTRMQKS